MQGYCKIYTDGACSGNPGDGGIAYIILNDKNIIIKEFCQYFPKTTNNRMELLAVIFAIRAVKDFSSNIVIYSDSTYVVNAINKKWLQSWQKQGLEKRKNADLWNSFIEVSQGMNIIFIWVKGHSNNLYNKKCDLLAKRAIKERIVY